MTIDRGMAVDLEIVEALAGEWRDPPDEPEVGCGALIPNRIRINGHTVLVPSNTTIDFAPIGNEGVVEVRLSLLVRSLKVGFEKDDGKFRRAASGCACRPTQVRHVDQ